ncbi:lipocalin-like domain-containing protein [Parabacteroides sp. OttesenSCG-928-K15]|nr:lipocalin-like domain-containing protein [Parabacteroides sp. OttesenSCG-928-K15]
MKTLLKQYFFNGKPLFFVVVILLFFSCKTDKDTELDGKWILREVVDADGTRQKVDTVWYNFQNTLFMYQLYNAADDKYPYIHGLKTKEGDNRFHIKLENSPVSVGSFLPLTDWEDRERTFTIEKHSHNKLILNSEGKDYFFDKY